MVSTSPAGNSTDVLLAFNEAIIAWFFAASSSGVSLRYISTYCFNSLKSANNSLNVSTGTYPDKS